mgnify:CR=1 FL=1
MSYSYQLKCLGNRNNLHKFKIEIINWLSKMNEINFENINQYKTNLKNEPLQNLLQWICKNKKYALYDEIISNIDSNKTILDLARTKLNEINHILLQMKEIALLMINGTITKEQRENYYMEIKSMCTEIQNIYNGLIYNGMNIFNHQWFINDTFDQCITTNKYYIIFPVCPDINNVENREDWTIEKWIQHGLNDIYTFGTYSIVIFLFTKFKDEYESITNNVLYEKGTFSRHLLNILDILCNIVQYETNKVQICYKDLCRSRDNILNQLEMANHHISRQKTIVKNSLEKELCQITDQINYMSVCINSNINTI